MKSTVLIGLYCLSSICYYYQEGILGLQSGYGAFFLIPVLCTNLFYCFKYILDKAYNAILKLFTAFIVINALYFIIDYLFIQNVPGELSFSFFKGVLLSMTGIYPLFYWSKSGLNLRVILLAMSVLAFILIWQVRLHNLMSEIKENFVDNTGYAFVSLLPSVFLIKRNNLLILIYMSVIMLAVVSCAKRGAIICGAVACTIIILYLLKEDNHRSTFIRKATILSAITIVIYYVIIQFEQNDYLLQRFVSMSEGNSSGRDRIYSNILTNFADEANIFQYLIGLGYCATPALSDGSHFAHNDWIELLADTGILGVGLYFCLIMALFKASLKAITTRIRYLLLIISVIWVMKTLFSMSFMDENNFILSMLLGYGLPLSQIRSSNCLRS